MGNLVALMAHTGRGGEVLLEESSHILKSEMGAIAQVAGLFHRTIRGERGAMDLGALAETISAQMKPNKLATALIEMETTHNGAGGTVLPLDHMAEVHALGRQHGIPVHTDGARLFNAAVALGVHGGADRAPQRQRDVLRLEGPERADRLAALRHATSSSPARAASAACSAAICARPACSPPPASWRWSSMVERLADDHRTAKQLADGLHRLAPSLVDPKSIETNIVRVDTTASGWPAETWSAALQRCDVRVSPGGPMQLRFVTHRHISPADIETTLQAFGDVWREAAGQPTARAG